MSEEVDTIEKLKNTIVTTVITKPALLLLAILAVGIGWIALLAAVAVHLGPKIGLAASVAVVGGIEVTAGLLLYLVFRTSKAAALLMESKSESQSGVLVPEAVVRETKRSIVRKYISSKEQAVISMIDLNPLAWGAGSLIVGLALGSHKHR